MIMESTSGRVEFSDEQKVQLTAAFNSGLNTVGKEKLEQIRELASKLGVEESKIKNWVGNERAKRKRAYSDNPPKKPPQKLRAPNSYNVFTKEFYLSSEGRDITDLSVKNRKAAEKWREMSTAEKAKYKQIASQASVANEREAVHFNKWHETHRILCNLQENCQWAERFGVHVLYMVCNERNHYVGGTQSGRQYLEGNPHIPTSFLVSTKPGITPEPKEPSSKKELRTLVQQQLNAKYSLAVDKPEATVPYKALKPENVIGLPPSVTLVHPTNMSMSDLQTVYSTMATIKFIGVPPKQLEPDHTYCTKNDGAVSEVLNSVTRASLGFTTLASIEGEDIPLEVCSKDN